MGRLKKPNLIQYTGGRGLDARRMVVLGVLFCYAGGLFGALATRKPILARVTADRSVLYRVGPDGRVSNRFRYTFANRGKAPATVAISTRDLPGASVSAGPVALSPGGMAAGDFEISASRGPELVRHFTIVAGDESIPMTFLAPPEGK
jgi:hypothetical protein